LVRELDPFFWMKCNALAMTLVLLTVATMGLAFMVVPTLKMLVLYVKVSLNKNELFGNIPIRSTT